MKIKKDKIIALYSGGDWNDASCNHFILKKDCDLEKEQRKWEFWYNNEYIPQLNSNKHPRFYTTIEWLIKQGIAKKVPKKQLLEVWEDEL